MPAIYPMCDDAGHWPVLWRAPRPPKDTSRWRWQYLGVIEEEDAADALQALRDRPGLRRQVSGQHRTTASRARP
jgi:hypothetical protein